MAGASYFIEPGRGLVHLQVSGELTADGLIAVMNRIGQDPRFRDGMSTLADYRDAYGNWDYSEIQRFRDYIVRLPGSRRCRWAAVVRPGTLVAIGHVLILISGAVEWRIRIELFEDPDAALRWIDGDLD